MALLSFKKQFLVVLFIPIIFFITALLTLSDYGISWDEPIHFHRGQAYLNYFLTGSKTFDNIPENDRSYYQNSSLTADYWIKSDSGHPPLNGILASFFNFILHDKLGLVGDIEAYHIFNILMSAIVVLIVGVFATQIYGKVAGIVAGITVATYPLFFAESHFNIKDPPLTAFYALTIWFFWSSIEKYNLKFLLAAIVSFAFGLGTKFNVLFMPAIILPYLFLRYYPFSTSNFANFKWKYLLMLILAPIIVAGIFISTWPYLWHDTVPHFLSIVKYYKDIGTGPDNLEFLLPGGFSTFPAIWFLSTTPPIVLLLTLLGIIQIFKTNGGKYKTGYLWLFWLIIPLVRVSVPNASIYGGIRQVMEFLPGLALVAGCGGVFI